MNVELLYFEGCPNYDALLPRLRTLLGRAGGEHALRLRRVASEDEARRLRFLGSPTVRVEGRDVEPHSEERGDYGMKCRLYRTADALSGVPPDEWILAALGRETSKTGAAPGRSR